jgi:ATP adenylyltransferase
MLYKDFLKTVTKCPFCEGENRIISDTLHAYMTYSIAPYHKHHLLVVPKRHVLQLNELNDEEMSDIVSLQKIGQVLLHKLGYKDYTILVRFGENSGKSVEHTHFHIVPDVRMGDVDHLWRERTVMNEEEISELMEELTRLL